MKKLLFVFAFVLSYIALYAGNGDTIHVRPHDKTLIQTNPARGVNEVLKWAVFPSEKMKYRKIIANVSMQCPEGMKCGAWDYLDYVIIRRKGGVNGKSLGQEIVRMLTPYGGWFDSTWKFTWQQDVTDWGYLLRDSVEIEYQHTGYESNDKVGWLVTVDFAIVEGTPVMEALGYQQLWNASFPYGDSSRPFENLVKPTKLEIPSGTQYMNYRILQTGHGMDRPDNCSEFCSKWREVYLDDRILDHKQLFIVCGNNPVFPQAGTWVYSRSNWCPGSLAIPDIYTTRIKQGNHTVDLKMEPYHSIKPSGGWLINANIFYYKAPWAKNDVAIEQIIAPGSLDEYSRMNPICSQPRILIKNNGSNALQSLTVEYGLAGKPKSKYVWEGNLPFMQQAEIMLPGEIQSDNSDFTFEVKLLKPNNTKDQYEADNFMSSQGKMPPLMEKNIIISLMPNHDSTQTSWQMTDINNNVIKERKGSDIERWAPHNDTLQLQPGCYLLNITDSQNDGLSFWANPRGGYGYIRILDHEGKLLKNFDPNFGTGIQYYFTVRDNYKIDRASVKPVFEFFPARTKDIAIADIVVDGTQDIVLKFIDAKGQVQRETKYDNFKSRMLKLDLSDLPASFYSVELTTSTGASIKQSIRKVDGKE